MNTYAGIGSRRTPDDVQRLMNKSALRLESLGFTLLSGGAGGADYAFSYGIQAKVIFLPWVKFEGLTGTVVSDPLAFTVASQLHPRWHSLSQGAQKLMARNTHQILGADLKSPVDFVLCWTPDGAETSTSIRTGGTGQAIRLANLHNIPVFNMHNPDALERLAKHIK